jgi:hypothetical protein
VEWLKVETLSSNPSTIKTKKGKKERNEAIIENSKYVILHKR